MDSRVIIERCEIDIDNLFFTIFTGVLVFILGQIFLEFILRPIQEYKKLKGKVAKYLVLYASCYSNPQFIEDGNSERHNKAGEEIRELASEVLAFSEITPHYLITLLLIPKKEKLKIASENLIGLSNSLYTSKNSIRYTKSFADDYRQKIESAMGIG